MNLSPAQSKTEWRRWAKARRSQLDTGSLGEHAVKRLELWPQYRNAEHILTYLAFGNELDLSALVSKSPDKQFYATRTHRDYTLTVHKLTSGLERHAYGFLQPTADSPAVTLGRLELLLIPGLAFDRTGTRLGYGGGFYDRLLAEAKSVPLVGVVQQSELIVPVLPSEPHDVRVTHLLSEQGVLEVRP